MVEPRGCAQELASLLPVLVEPRRGGNGTKNEKCRPFRRLEGMGLPSSDPLELRIHPSHTEDALSDRSVGPYILCTWR
jgi:hypothetical protein